MKIYDISAVISEDLPGFRGARHTVTETSEISKGDAHNSSQITMSSHMGTHADVPYHFVADGVTCDKIPLDIFYGPAKVARLKVSGHVTKADLTHLNINEGDRLLLDTGQSALMQQGTFCEDYIGLTPDAAEYLVEKKVKTIGIDYLSIEPFGTEVYPTHKLLLGEGICVLEGLVLENVPEGEYILSALPLKIKNGNGSPVRAVLVAT